MIDLDQLDRELELDDLDELDDFDELDDSELAAAEIADALAELGSSPSRKSIHGITERLREHPAVWAMLDEWNIGDDASAEKALANLAGEFGVIVPGPCRKAASVHLDAVSDSLAECAWPGCKEPRKERQGSRGRHPKHCPKHTFEWKRKADRERLRVKRSGTLKLSDCCKEWSQSGHRGRCQQHRDNAAASAPPYPLTAIEAAYLGAPGFHLVLSL
jgi:hypothetical protein